MRLRAVNRRTKAAADRIVSRIRSQRAVRQSAALATIQKAHAVAHASWNFMTAEWQGEGDAETNQAVYLEWHASYMAFCRVFCAELEIVKGR